MQSFIEVVWVKIEKFPLIFHRSIMNTAPAGESVMIMVNSLNLDEIKVFVRAPEKHVSNDTFLTKKLHFFTKPY